MFIERRTLDTEVSEDVIFEPVLHPSLFARKQFETIEERYTSGDTSANFWNKAVLTRIQEYRPLVLSVDSLNPLGGQWDWQKRRIWLSLPGRPKKINELGKVFVIAGDSANSWLGQDGIISLAEETMKAYDSYGKSSSYISHGLDPLTLMALGGTLDYFNRRPTQKAVDGDGVRDPSRRMFLKKAADYSLLSSILLLQSRFFLEYFLPKSNNSKTKDLLQSLIELLRPRLYTSDWARGRTALIIAKAKETKTLLGINRKAAAIMGSFHAFDLAELATEEDLKIAVHNHAEEMCDILEQVSRKFPEFGKEATKNRLLDFFATTEIYQVNDPGGDDINPNLQQLIETTDLITHLYSFRSTLVNEAVSDLRDA